jgi:peptidoglycan/xylan/chitin deacetylase (PgdA/CDA1 family)
MKDMSFGEICEDIYKNDIVLESAGVKTDLFMPPYGVVTEEVQKAAAAMDKQLILYNSSPARTDYAEEKYTAEEVVKKYYSDARLVLCRGDITYFNMNVYDDDDSMAELVRAVYQKKVLPTDYGTLQGHILQICTVSQLLDNTWQYPAATNATYNRIGASGKMQRPLDQMMSGGYIGNPYVELSGFSEGELPLLDQTGRINTGGTNTVFLTFDDWGNEETIGKLLYVLKKHNVKATFFIKTEYVMDGSTENLLRAIAEDGHDIASHTDSHMTIDVTADQQAALQQNLVKSNQTLSKVVGDTGRLMNYFRPPTLAINRIGLSTVFDCGYSYIINGDVSTGDYSLSVDELYDVLMNGAFLDSGERLKIGDGSIVVMHINTNATNTARAVDRYLNTMESLPDGDPNKFNFARLSDYLH